MVQNHQYNILYKLLHRSVKMCVDVLQDAYLLLPIPHHSFRVIAYEKQLQRNLVKLEIQEFRPPLFDC